MRNLSKVEKEREWNRLHNADAISKPDAPHPAANRPSIGETVNDITESQTPVHQAPDTSFRPLEMSIIRYCIRYGYKEVFSTVDEDDDSLMNVLEYVESELEADDMKFSIPEYAAIFRN